MEEHIEVKATIKHLLLVTLKGDEIFHNVFGFISVSIRLRCEDK